MSHNHDEHEPTETELWATYPSLTGIERIRCLISLGSFRRDAGDLETCWTLLEQAEEFASAEDFSRERGEILTDMGIVRADQKDWEGALEIYGQAEKLLDQDGSEDQKATLYQVQARAFGKVGNVEDKIVCLLQAAESFIACMDYHGAGHCLDDLADFQNILGRGQDAYRTRLRARDIFSGAAPLWRMARVEMDLSADAISAGNYDIAMRHAEEAINLAKSCSCDRCTPHAEYALGYAYLHLGQVDLATETLDRACQSFRTLGITSSQAGCLLYLAEAKLASNPQEAKALIRQALSIYMATDHNSGVSRALLELGLCHLHLGENVEAVSKLSQCLEFFKERNYLASEQECYENLARAYLNMSMPNEALENLRALAKDDQVQLNQAVQVERGRLEAKALMMAGHVKQAQELAEKLLSEIEPGTYPSAEADLHFLLGTALSESDPKRATQELMRAAAGYITEGQNGRAQEIMESCVIEPAKRIHQIQKLEENRNHYEDLVHSDSTHDGESHEESVIREIVQQAQKEAESKRIDDTSTGA